MLVVRRKAGRREQELGLSFESKLDLNHFDLFPPAFYAMTPPSPHDCTKHLGLTPGIDGPAGKPLTSAEEDRTPLPQLTGSFFSLAFPFPCPPSDPISHNSSNHSRPVLTTSRSSSTYVLPESLSYQKKGDEADFDLLRSSVFRLSSSLSTSLPSSEPSPRIPSISSVSGFHGI